MADREPLRAWAAAQAPALLADARRDALAQARRILRDELTAALLDAARSRDGAAAPEAPPREPAPAGTLAWVYGVVRAGTDAPATAGLEDAAVRHVQAGRLAALVSTVPANEYTGPTLGERLEDLRAVEAMSRAHDGVLERARAAGDVLPFRMCTIYESDDAVRRMLGAEERTFDAVLERIAGKEEWGVKAFLQPAAVATASAGAPAAVSGAAYLARRRTQRDEAEMRRQALEETIAGVHARLAERASGAVLSRPQDRRLSGRDAEMVLNGAYLVPREGAGAFAGVVDELRAAHADDGLTLEMTGPWPPYNFVADRS